MNGIDGYYPTFIVAIFIFERKRWCVFRQVKFVSSLASSRL